MSAETESGITPFFRHNPVLDYLLRFALLVVMIVLIFMIQNLQSEVYQNRQIGCENRLVSGDKLSETCVTILESNGVSVPTESKAQSQ